MFKVLSRSEIEYALFVSKVVGPYDQPVREAVDYAERYPRTRVSGGNLRGRRVGPNIRMGGVLFKGGLTVCKAPCPSFLREVTSLSHLAII